MRALVVYESMYGNTHAVAVDIAAGLRATNEVTLVPVTRATRELVAASDLIVAGCPTHLHGMPTVSSRRMAAETARKQGSGLNLDPDADSPGLRAWLEGLNAENVLAAAFDTRFSGVPVSRAAPAGALRICWAATAAACWSRRKASSSASRARCSRERPRGPARGEHWSARPHARLTPPPSSCDLRKGRKAAQEISACSRSSQAGGHQKHRSAVAPAAAPAARPRTARPSGPPRRRRRPAARKLSS